MTKLLYTYIASPIGALLVAGNEAALHRVSFAAGRRAFEPHPDWERSDAPFVEVRRQIDAYFAGDLRQFDLPLHLAGTAFQNRVWRRLADIAFARTRSYGEIAAELDAPGASRAVGAANGANPIPLILPCHRVIGARGALVGFGGGLKIKEYLLRHEAAQAGAPTGQLNLFEGRLFDDR